MFDQLRKLVRPQLFVYHGLGLSSNTIEVQQHRSAPPPAHKLPGTIDVIGSSVRDTRRPQPSEFRDIEQQDLYVYS
jgi:hypothetical protein